MDTAEIITTIIIMILCLVAEGFFSGSEIGVVSSDRMKLRHEAAKGSRGAKLALEMLKKPEWLLSTTLVGTNIAIVTNTTMAAALMIGLFGDSGSWLVVLLVAPLIWVFGEIVPKSVFQQRANVITPKAIFVLRFFSIVFFPILIVFSFLAKMLAKLAGEKTDQNPFTLREEIKTMMQMSPEEGDIEPDEQSMIRRLFSFGETRAMEVMVPLVDVVSVERGMTCGDVIKIATESGHKKLPVHEGRVDQMVGVVDTLEFLGVDPKQSINKFVKSISYAPESKSIQKLLVDLRQSGQTMVVVVDEFGGTEGLVTIEDIMEEVVDELQDEFDIHEKPTQWVKKVAENEYKVSARVDIDTLNEELGLDLPFGNYNSLSGFLLEKAQDIPPEGEVVEYKSLSFTIERAIPQAIQEVRIAW